MASGAAARPPPRKRRLTSLRPWATANWPTTLAIETRPPSWARPLAASLGISSDGRERQPDRDVDQQVQGGVERASDRFGHVAILPARGSEPPRHTQSAAQHPGVVGELAGVLDQEAGLADELARLLWQHPERTVAPLVGVADLLFVVVIVLVVDDHDEPLFEDHVEAGLHVIGVLVLFLFLLVFVLAHDLGLGVDHDILQVFGLDASSISIVVVDVLVVDRR